MNFIVHTLAQLLRSSAQIERTAANKLLHALPLATFFAGVASLPNNQLSADAKKIMTTRINATVNRSELEMQLQKIPLVQLLAFYQDQASALQKDKADLLIAVFKSKLALAPIHQQHLCTENGTMRLPKELELPASTLQAERGPL